MEVKYREAVDFFSKLPPSRRFPGAHPAYVVADARRDPSLEPFFFIFENGKERFYLAALKGRVPDSNYFDLQSVYGYGGPIISEAGPEFIKAAWAVYGKYCRENSILAEFVRFHPLMENWATYPGQIIDDREVVWIDLAQSDFFPSYDKRVRTAVRKAQSSDLRVEWTNLNSTDFPQLYTESMQAMGAAASYYFPAEYFQALGSWPQARLALCRQAEEIVAGAIFLIESELLEYHLAASRPAGKKNGAANLILHEAALLGRELSLKKLHLGGGTDSRPDNPLLFFKSGFSAERARFKIGSQVYDRAAYDQLRASHEKRHGPPSKRILFYR